jgi:hypothetical protein
MSNAWKCSRVLLRVMVSDLAERQLLCRFTLQNLTSSITLLVLSSLSPVIDYVLVSFGAIL